MKIRLKVNGGEHDVEVDPQTPLLFVLNDELGLRGPRFGCGLAQCGACTVVLRGRAVRSCVMPVSAVGEGEVTTLEGLGTPEKPHPIQQAFMEEGAAQCGYCLSGVILTAKTVLDQNPAATDQDAPADDQDAPASRRPAGYGSRLRRRCPRWPRARVWAIAAV